ncbi:MAG: hypothetical protein AAF639_23530 [Chloroflexota bacterium]
MSNTSSKTHQNTSTTQHEPTYLRKPRQRPFGVTIIAILHLWKLFLLITELLFFRGSSYLNLLPTLETTTMLAVNTDYLSTIVGIATAIGLWRLRRWAWVLTMLQVGVSMVIGLLAYWDGQPQYLVMLSNIVMVFYLNQREVQQQFDVR